MRIENLTINQQVYIQIRYILIKIFLSSIVLCLNILGIR